MQNNKENTSPCLEQKIDDLEYGKQGKSRKDEKRDGKAKERQSEILNKVLLLGHTHPIIDLEKQKISQNKKEVIIELIDGMNQVVI